MATFFEKMLIQLERVGIAPEIVEHIRAYIESAEPLGLIYISPVRLADEWNLPPRAVLEAFLYGTRLGIFDLRWNLRCPSCKGFGQPTDRLSCLRSDLRCDYCQSDYRAGFDDAVEVTFEINENIRVLTSRSGLKLEEYFRKIRPDLINYWNLIEKQMSLTVDAYSTWGEQIDLEPGTYYLHNDESFRLFAPLVVSNSPAQSIQNVEIVYEGTQLIKPNTKAYGFGSFILHVINKSTQPVTLTFSYYKPYPWTSAAEIASMQTFHDLFSSEVISADETFSIQNIVFVFMDIKGSTALYERLGDADAYPLVKEHFKILTQKIKEHNGAVVKTIGDTVMATFMVSADAMEALFDIQQTLDKFNAQENLRDEIIIKVGVHNGPCIVVNANDRLDYFGQTVNIAASVQHLSTGRDIMLTKSFYDEPNVHSIVKNSNWQIYHLQAKLRGIEDTYKVVHLLPTT